MNKTEFKNLKANIKTYMNSLNIDDVLEEYVKKGLLNVNKKLSQGDSLNYGLELLPSVLSGKNLCPMAGDCKYTCIAFSGTNNMIASTKIKKGTGLSTALMSRARKTFLYLNDTERFEKLLKIEITTLSAKAELLGKTANFRLNVFSDIDWITTS
jgi:hypothetical protein